MDSCYKYSKMIQQDCNACQELLRLMYDEHHEFLKDVKGNWDNHRPLLLLALELTTGPAIEFGAGEGSTPWLRNYLAENNRSFLTYESNMEWAEMTGSYYVTSWENPELYRDCAVCFIDHAPGEHRKVAVERMADKADIIVVHDTELNGAGDYQLEPILSTFKFRLNYNRLGGGAGATAVSNTIDLNRFRGLSLGQYKFDND